MVTLRNDVDYLGSKWLEGLGIILFITVFDVIVI